MLIYSKDRDSKFEFNGEDHVFYTKPVYHKGICFGINLYCDEFLLGDFDTLDEIIEEIDKILKCPGDVYYVSGYSDYDGESDWNDLCKLMAESEADQ